MHRVKLKAIFAQWRRSAQFWIVLSPSPVFALLLKHGYLIHVRECAEGSHLWASECLAHSVLSNSPADLHLLLPGFIQNEAQVSALLRDLLHISII